MMMMTFFYLWRKYLNVINWLVFESFSLGFGSTVSSTPLFRSTLRSLSLAFGSTTKRLSSAMQFILAHPDSAVASVRGNSNGALKNVQEQIKFRREHGGGFWGLIAHTLKLKILFKRFDFGFDLNVKTIKRCKLCLLRIFALWLYAELVK